MAFIPQSIGCPMTTNTDERAERMNIGEISERVMTNPDFEAALQSLILTLEGPARWHQEGLTTFSQWLTRLAREAEGQ